MRDQWFGDESDFVKYRLLRKICGITANDGGQPLQLAVVWYKRESKLVKYLRSGSTYESEDQDLFQHLRCWIEDEATRGVSLIERSFLLPPGTVWFSELVPASAKARTVWIQRALAKVADSRVVFLDPDNGLAPQKPNAKHVLFSELKTFCGLVGQPTVIAYQSFRHKNLEDQVREQVQEIKECLGSEESPGRTPFAVRHPKLTRRFFYVIPSEQDCELVQARIRELHWKILPAHSSG